jgi:molybdopterin-guanine dinucleotide biosynthesis protein A
MMECYILAGGQSRRFGEDKTLFLLKGKPCIQWVVEQAQRVCDRVFIVAKEPQKYSFLKGVELLKDILQEQFALAGLYTALSHTNQYKVVILSADMPLIKGELISLIWERSKDKITLFKVKGKIFPLFGVYPKGVKSALEEYLKGGGLRVMEFVEKVGYEVVEDVEPFSYAFINMNTKEDARIILEIL